MNPKIRRCPKCGQTLIQTKTKWEHILNKYNCLYESERFIKPENAPLFLRVETKDKEDKKFLVSIMQEPVKPRRSWFFGGPDLSIVFVRTEGKKYLDVYNKEQWTAILAKETLEREKQ